MKYNINMPIARFRRGFKKPQPFDWFALLVLASFAFIVLSIVSNDVEKFGKEMYLEARHLQAEILSIKDSQRLR